MANTKYTNQRKRVNPPHVSLRTLRRACKMTLDEVCARVSEEIGRPFERGSLSAIENGHRGASSDVLRGLAAAYDIDIADLDTDYQPRERAA